MRTRNCLFGIPALIFAVGTCLGATAASVPANDSRIADAAETQDWAQVRDLLKQHAAVNGLQPDRTSALIWAAHWGDVGTVDALLAAGADVKTANRYGTSALSEAAEIGNVAILERLVKAGADPNTISQNNESVLMSAARVGKLDAARFLVEHGADVNARDMKDEETPLMYAVFSENLPIVQLLISKGADVNAVAHTLDLPRRKQPSASIFGSRITGGFTALMFSARQDNVAITKALLDGGANPNVSDRDGMTPMIVACLNGSFETAALLLNHGADPSDGSLWETMEFRNFKGEIDHHIQPEITSKLDAFDFARMLLEKGADPTKPYGKIRTLHKYAATGLVPPVTTSPLDRAIESVDVASIRMMLDTAKARGFKFDPSAIIAAEVRAYPILGPGKMIFRVASEKDAADVIAMAVQFGGDVNKANLQGNTPLHLAAQQGADDIVKALASMGAKLDVKNQKGLTPLDLALGKGGRLVTRGNGGGGEQGPAPVYESTATLLRELMSKAGIAQTVAEK